MHIRKRLGFAALRKVISERLCEIEDCRQQGKVDYTLHDCAMSAFAMMFFQDASLLEFQRRMPEGINCNNCLTKTSKKGVICYSHQILQAVIVHPDNKQVIPLAPEAFKIPMELKNRIEKTMLVNALSRNSDRHIQN